jgi:hypothetical protein
MGRGEMGTWIVVSAGKSYEILTMDWFGKPRNTLEPSLWIDIPSSTVTLLLRFGKIASTVGWNVVCLQPIGVLFYNDKCSLLWYYLPVYECISDMYLIII